MSLDIEQPHRYKLLKLKCLVFGKKHTLLVVGIDIGIGT